MEDVDPLASYYASVSRMMANGERFYPDQRMSRMEYHFLTLTNSTHTPLIFLLVAELVALLSRDASQSAVELVAPKLPATNSAGA